MPAISTALSSLFCEKYRFSSLLMRASSASIILSLALSQVSNSTLAVLIRSDSHSSASLSSKPILMPPSVTVPLLSQSPNRLSSFSLSYLAFLISISAMGRPLSSNDTLAALPISGCVCKNLTLVSASINGLRKL